MCVKGGGETYKLTLQTTDQGLGGVGWQCDFVTTPSWQEIQLPFSRFIPSFRGRCVDIRAMHTKSHMLLVLNSRHNFAKIRHKFSSC